MGTCGVDESHLGDGGRPSGTSSTGPKRQSQQVTQGQSTVQDRDIGVVGTTSDDDVCVTRRPREAQGQEGFPDQVHRAIFSVEAGVANYVYPYQWYETIDRMKPYHHRTVSSKGGGQWNE